MINNKSKFKFLPILLGSLLNGTDLMAEERWECDIASHDFYCSSKSSEEMNCKKSSSNHTTTKTFVFNGHKKSPEKVVILGRTTTIPRSEYSVYTPGEYAISYSYSDEGAGFARFATNTEKTKETTAIYLFTFGDDAQVSEFGILNSMYQPRDNSGAFKHMQGPCHRI